MIRSLTHPHRPVGPCGEPRGISLAVQSPAAAAESPDGPNESGNPLPAHGSQVGLAPSTHASRPASGGWQPIVVKDLRQMWHRWWLGLGLPAWWVLYGYCAWLILGDGHWDRIGMVHGVSVINAVVVGAASALALESHLGHIHLDAIMLRAVGYRRYLMGKLLTTALITTAIYAPFAALLGWGWFIDAIGTDWLFAPGADAIGVLAAASAVTTQSIIHAGARCRVRFTLICLPVLVGGLALPILLREGIGRGPIEAGASSMLLGALLLGTGLMIHLARRVRWYPAYGRRPMHAWFGLPDDFFQPPHHDRRQ